MEEIRTLNVVESLILMILVPSIPVIVVGLTWLMTCGGFDFLMVVRSIPMVGLVGVLSLLGVIAGLSSISDSMRWWCW
tara:strand:+ start:1352 stop:1585 length:234 start_codon:yes stop_codon:yes gene_type:complete